MAPKHNFTADQGSYWSQQLLWKDSEDVPIDLTGFTARMQLRRNFNDPTADLELTTEDGAITLGGVDGTILIEIASELTAALPIRDTQTSYVYDLEVIPAAAEQNARRLIQGKFTITREVTR